MHWWSRRMERKVIRATAIPACGMDSTDEASSDDSKSDGKVYLSDDDSFTQLPQRTRTIAATPHTFETGPKRVDFRKRAGNNGRAAKFNPRAPVDRRQRLLGQRISLDAFRDHPATSPFDASESETSSKPSTRPTSPVPFQDGQVPESNRSPLVRETCVAPPKPPSEEAETFTKIKTQMKALQEEIEQKIEIDKGAGRPNELLQQSLPTFMKFERLEADEMGAELVDAIEDFKNKRNMCANAEERTLLVRMMLCFTVLKQFINVQEHKDDGNGASTTLPNLKILANMASQVTSDAGGSDSTDTPTWRSLDEFNKEHQNYFSEQKGSKEVEIVYKERDPVDDSSVEKSLKEGSSWRRGFLKGLGQSLSAVEKLWSTKTSESGKGHGQDNGELAVERKAETENKEATYDLNEYRGFAVRTAYSMGSPIPLHSPSVHGYRRSLNLAEWGPKAHEVTLCHICETQWPLRHFEEHARLCGHICRLEADRSLLETKLWKLLNMMKSYEEASFWHSELMSILEELIWVCKFLLVFSGKIDARVMKKFKDPVEKLTNGSEHLDSLPGFAACKTFAQVIDSIVVEIAGQRTSTPTPTSRSSSGRQKKRSINDFNLIKPISRGAFGRVYLARKIATDTLYAIKVLRKQDIIRKHLVDRANSERNILVSANNKFVVKCYYTFTTEENLYIVMEYLNGGDCYSLLQALGALDEHVAKIYIGETVLALEYLHDQGVIHRDVKPENLLIGSDGHLKLVDFGLSSAGVMMNHSMRLTESGKLRGSTSDDFPNQDRPKEPVEPAKRTGRALGTPDYLAPEILLEDKHGAEVDWWSLGAMLFEFVVGHPPFTSDTPELIFENILDRNIQWRDNEDEPVSISPECRDLIEKLLNLNPSERLGHDGANSIKQHPFFEDIEWEALPTQDPIFLPSVESPEDISYFSAKSVAQKSIAADFGRALMEKSVCKSIEEFVRNHGQASSSDPRGSGWSYGSARVNGLQQEDQNNFFDGYSFTNYMELEEANKRKLKMLREEFANQCDDEDSNKEASS